MQCLVDSAKEYGLYPKSSRKPLKGFIQATNTTRGFFFSFFFFFLKITKVSRWRMDYGASRVDVGRPGKRLGNNESERK